MMDSYTIQKPEIMLAGVSVRTTNAEENGPSGRLPQLWENYFHSNLASQIPACNPDLIYALYTDYESDANGAYTVLIGHETVRDGAEAEHSFSYALVPESKYIVFTTRRGPVYEVVAQAWREIWAYFSTSSEVRTFSGDFELYDSRSFDPEHTEVKIHIAIK